MSQDVGSGLKTL